MTMKPLFYHVKKSNIISLPLQTFKLKNLLVRRKTKRDIFNPPMFNQFDIASLLYTSFSVYTGHWPAKRKNIKFPDASSCKRFHIILNGRTDAFLFENTFKLHT